jgi:hypothetical protein
MPDALPDATLPISRLGTGSTNGSNNGGGWGYKVGPLFFLTTVKLMKEILQLKSVLLK